MKTTMRSGGVIELHDFRSLSSRSSDCSAMNAPQYLVYYLYQKAVIKKGMAEVRGIAHVLAPASVFC